MTMKAEIYWTLESGEGDEVVIPARITAVERLAAEIRVRYVGVDPETRETFEGVLRLTRRLGEQQVSGSQSFKPFGEGWKPLPFRFAGRFLDRRFDRFSGTWFEEGKRFRVDIEGLAEQWASARTASPPKNRSKRRKSRKRRHTGSRS